MFSTFSPVSRPLILTLALLASTPALALPALNQADKGNWSAALREAKADKGMHALVTWMYLLDPNTHPRYSEYEDFYRQHPNWPRQERFKARAARALLNDKPQSPDRALVREVWVHGDFSQDEEQQFISRYGSLLEAQDVAARNDQLNRGNESDADIAHSLWMTGWSKLTEDKSPAGAYRDFAQMFDIVKSPVSKSRAAYWAARAAEQLGNQSDAQQWYRHAALNPTVFYGQLAMARLSNSPRLELPPEQISAAPSNSPLFYAARYAARADKRDLATVLIGGLMKNANSQQEAAASARAIAEVNKSLGVKAAKLALQHQGVVLPKTGYPRPSTSTSGALEPALALAIARQESEFDPRARSSAGALGLMQVLPGTAKETARKAGIAYSPKKLWDAPYNMKIGATYLSRLISAYDGSYVLAIAAYNAGPGRVRQWVETYGSPGNSVESAVNWIEQIPIEETRNYVMRVMENLQVYRALEGKTSLKITEDLSRGQREYSELR